MKSKMKRLMIRFTRYEYLLRMILTIFTIMLVPALIMTFTLTRRSYEKITTQNNEYYTEQTLHFSGVYQEAINRLHEVAQRIGIDGKLNMESLANRPWHRIEAVKIMSDYKVAVPMVDYVGICFYDLNYVFTSSGSNFVNSFADLTFADNANMAESFAKLLKKDNGERISILSSFDTAAADRRIIITIPISTEFSYKNNAVVIYSLSISSFPQYFMRQPGMEQYGLAIFDKQCKPFYYNQRFDSELCYDDNFISFLKNSQKQYFENRTGAEFSRIFRWYDANTEMFFVTLVPEGIIMQRVRSFYNSVQMMVLFMSAGLILLTAVTVYINYRPVMSMVRRIRDMRVSGAPVNDFSELKTVEAVLTYIQGKYKEMSVAVSEQRLMIMENILGNILYGLPIQTEKVSILDSSLLSKSFMVISVYDLRLNNNDREQLTRIIEDELGITVYISDIQYEPIMVFICAISSESACTAERVEKILKRLYNKDFIAGSGEVVDNLNDIRKSYINSRIMLDERTKNLDKAHDAANHKLELSMLEFVNNNFNNQNITLVQAADCLNMSIYTYSRMFKEITGIGFKEYISAKRMDLAKELLLSTKKSINEIALETGFESPSYFVTWFKSNMGMTPSHFRKYSTYQYPPD